MNGVNKRQAVLEILREAGEPISVTDCAAKVAANLHTFQHCVPGNYVRSGIIC